jgi:hypothetical protein
MEDVVEDVVLGKQTMICAKVVLIPVIVEWCQLIFGYLNSCLILIETIRFLFGLFSITKNN